MLHPQRQFGFTLVELAVVIVIFSIALAVGVPRWMGSVERARAKAAAHSITTDIAALRRLCVRTGQPVTISFTVGTGTLVIAPPIPDQLGDSAGNVDYQSKFSGLKINAVDFNGSNSFTINIYGDLIAAGSGAELTAALIKISVGDLAMTIDLLAEQGLIPVATVAAAEPSRNPLWMQLVASIVHDHSFACR